MKHIILSVICFFLFFPVFSQNNAAGFRQEGIASWYGADFAGRPTASGERFNPRDMTAAHPSLPFGTFVRVTNTHNGRQVIVRVNDRGPFVAARIIDLSEQAAKQLDMILTGTAPVIVEAVSSLPGNNTASGSGSNTNTETVSPSQNQPNTNATIPLQIEQNENQPAIAANPGVAPAGDGKVYRIQVGAYRNAKNAVDAFTLVQNAGLTPAYERYNDFYRVVVAQVPSNNLQSVVDTLTRAGFQEVLIREEL